MLDAPDHGPDPHGFANHELILDDDEKAVDEIADQMLRAETERQARKPRGRSNGRDVEAELRQCRQDRADDDHGGSRAVQ